MRSLKGGETGTLFAWSEKIGCRSDCISSNLLKTTAMAKANSLITLLGTYDGMTFVKSPTYGDHVRAARGTHKKAVLNEACQEQSRKLVKSNAPAQIIRDAMNPYRQDFYYGPLWQDLVSRTNDALEKGAAFDFSRVRPFEMHPYYPLARLANVTTTTSVDAKLSALHVIVSPDMPPLFDDALIDGYRIGVIVLFPDLQKHSAKTERAQSDTIALKEVESLTVGIPIPSDAESFLVFVRIDGCKNGKPDDTLAAKGMRMVKAGKVEPVV